MKHHFYFLLLFPFQPLYAMKLSVQPTAHELIPIPLSIKGQRYVVQNALKAHEEKRKEIFLNQDTFELHILNFVKENYLSQLRFLTNPPLKITMLKGSLRAYADLAVYFNKTGKHTKRAYYNRKIIKFYSKLGLRKTPRKIINFNQKSIEKITPLWIYEHNNSLKIKGNTCTNGMHH